MMSWSTFHNESEQYASLAEEASRTNDPRRAAELYHRAAEAETKALSDLDPSKARTVAITAISAASLWFKCHEYNRAMQVAYESLSRPNLPSFAAEQLRSLLQILWNAEERQKSGIEFMRGEILVSVSGGEVVTGGAPLDLILLKVDEVSRMFYRIIELILQKPFRRRGLPEEAIREQFRPWLFQAPAGSYQFAVRVERPSQLAMFPDMTADAELVTTKFLDVLEASADESDRHLEQIVPQPEYRDAFLKLTRNLAPTGKTFGRMEIRSATDSDRQPVVLLPEAREVISTTIRKNRPKKESEEEQVKIPGTLRGLQLDNDWLEIDTAEEESKTIRIHQAGEMIDDVIGPMVNHRVIVEVSRKGSRYYFRDIQADV